MKIEASKKDNKLFAFNREYRIDFTVRTIINGLLKDKIARTIPDQLPYVPEVFPDGEYRVYEPVPRETELLRPYFIPTSARNEVAVWELAEEGTYKWPTHKKVFDYGYGLHYSPLNYTDGCIRFIDKDELVDFAHRLTAALKTEKVFLAVK